MSKSLNITKHLPKLAKLFGSSSGDEIYINFKEEKIQYIKEFEKELEKLEKEKEEITKSKEPDSNRLSLKFEV